MPPAFRLRLSAPAPLPTPQNYVHPSDFVPSGRVSRNDDLPLKSGSRWATLSLYENDPRIIRGQLRKLEEHKSSTAAARGQDETLASLRRAVMGAEQRAMFGRQRMEQSLRYVKSGLSTRPSYEMAGASLGATDSLASTTGNLTARMGLLSTTAARRMLSSAPPGQRPDLSELAVQLPASSYVQVRSRLEAEHKAAITQSGQRAVATARKAADARERQTISRQLHELDQFEYQLRAGSKKKNGSSSQQRESGDNY